MSEHVQKIEAVLTITTSHRVLTRAVLLPDGARREEDMLAIDEAFAEFPRGWDSTFRADAPECK